MKRRQAKRKRVGLEKRQDADAFASPLHAAEEGREAFVPAGHGAHAAEPAAA